MMRNYSYLYDLLAKNAAAVLTPEAEQAAVGAPQQPGMPPQDMPMDPSMAGGAPMPPDAGMPPQGGSPVPGAPMPGAQLPPEILQDQLFLQFLQEAIGIMFDPNSGMFVDPQGQPVPPEAIMQIYQEFQMQMQAQQAGAPMPGQPASGMEAGMPPQGMPMDPSMAGGAPMPPDAGMPPQGMPMDPSMAAGMEQQMPGVSQEAAPMPEAAEPQQDIVSAVMQGVEAVLQEYTAATDKRISALLDKVEALTAAIDALRSTTDKRSKDDEKNIDNLRAEIEADLAGASAEEVPQEAVMPVPFIPQEQPVKTASAKPSYKPVNLFSLIQGGI